MSATNRRPLLIIFLTIFIDLLGFGIVLPLLPRYASYFEASNLTIGLLMSSFSAMQFLFAPLWGRLSDRIGRRPVLIVGLFGSVVFYTLFGVASAIGDLTLLFLARIGAGIAGATISTAQAYIADSTDHAHRTAGMSLVGAAFGIGFTFGPLFGWGSLQFSTGSFFNTVHAASPMPGFVAAGFSLVAALLAIFMLPESLRPEHRGSVETSPKGFAVFARLRVLAEFPAVRNLIAVFFTATFAFAIFETTLATLTHNRMSLDDQQNFLMFAYIGVCLSIAQGFFVRRMSRFVPDMTLATLGIVLLGFGLCGIAAAAVWQSLMILVLVMPLLILGFALLSTSSQSMVSRFSPANRQGEFLGINQSASAFARIAGPVIGYKLMDVDLTSPYWFSAGVMVFAYLLLQFLPRQSVPVTADATL